jgi:acyl-coenzyme A thioesterase PaaI-like protein
MDKLNQLVNKAQNSAFYLWFLNVMLWKMVPFNKPHSLKIVAVSTHEIQIKLPYIKNNQNHIHGIHACALATLCEYTSGIMLLLNISPSAYRIILKNISMTYHYQGKMDVVAAFKMSQDWVDKEIVEPLKTADAIYKQLQVDVYDTQQNHICSGLINWQIKAWNNVKTKS